MDTKVLKEAQTAFIRARLRLMQNHPFWAHLVMKLEVCWDESAPGGISATDGKRMMVNPETFLKLSTDEQPTVLAHEAWHCAAGHLWRVGSRDKMRWNLAGDIYIANAMEADGFTLLGVQEQFFASIKVKRQDYMTMPTEEIYEKLPAKLGKGQGEGKGQPGQGDGQGHQHWQGGCYHEPKSSQERSQGENEWRRNVIEASQVAGNVPGSASELVKAALPKPPFTLKLFEYLNRGLGGDTDWACLNRRQIWRRTYMPTETKMVMGRVAWVTDTSGSMCQEQLALAFGYFRAFREAHPCVADLICCDYGVSSHQTFAEHEQLPTHFEAKGRGGTSFNAPFEMLKEKRIEPKVVIYVTDGYGTCNTKAPGCPVLWVVVRGDAGFKPPFGEVVQVKGE